MISVRNFTPLVLPLRPKKEEVKIESAFYAPVSECVCGRLVRKGQRDCLPAAELASLRRQAGVFQKTRI